MKKKLFVGLISCVVGLLIVLSAMGSYKKRKQAEDRYLSLTTLESPDMIYLEKDNQKVMISAGDSEYEEIHQIVSDCWKNSLKNGKLEFVLLLYITEPEEDTIRLTYHYDSPILWQPYGTDGMVIEADTYTFFPFYKPYEEWGVISEKQNYTTEAYVILFHASEELREKLTEIWTDHAEALG